MTQLSTAPALKDNRDVSNLGPALVCFLPQVVQQMLYWHA